ncbi:glutamate dehydrogenase (NAD) [Arboricoccus pini]|uniref:Glutamate dehydrogenase (NAD) n=1 Tax=Arboricoccus pini TaxID=1963835 RepID=A0A212QQH4_9PROT|nr:NAD-glutamate dehydrogenase [Arboricoccus pini]SNB61735.1 glutamate dehydrogenase (NAD) [Arboricoccus pini]
MGSLRDDMKLELVEQVCLLVTERFPPAQAEAVQAFVRAYFHDTPPGDLLIRDSGDLYGAALAHLRFAERREPGHVALRLYNPQLDQHGWDSRHTILEIVNDDMPFLVDSVQAELARAGIGIHLTIHPVLPVERDVDGRLVRLGDVARARESFIHMELDRLSDNGKAAAVEEGLRHVLDDVRVAVRDWQAMTTRMCEAADEVASAPGDPSADLADFLRWLADGRFTFLGYATCTLAEGEDGPALHYVADSGLGILRQRADGSASASFGSLPLAARRLAADGARPLVVAKASSRSTVHRNSYLDVISIKTLDATGRIAGEHRFLGLFTSAAYSLGPRSIPLLRTKLDQVTQELGADPHSHAGKALAHILETYPRDELFQMEVAEIVRIAKGILELQERQRVRLFIRRDPQGSFASCLVYVPRERYNTALRERIQSALQDAFKAVESEFQVQISESVLARLFFLLRLSDRTQPEVDPEALERQVAIAAHAWIDRLKEALVDAIGEAEGNRLVEIFGRTMPLAYQEAVPARAAVLDLKRMAALSGAPEGALSLTLYRRLEEPAPLAHFRIIRRDRPMELSEALPILESLGLRILSEQPFTLRTTGGQVFAIHDFGIRRIDGSEIDIEAARADFQAAFEAIWSGGSELDGFNRLVLAAGLPIRDVSILRAYCRYYLQVGTPFSQAYIERVLTIHAGIAGRIVALFHLRFEPGLAERDRAVGRAREALDVSLDAVQSLDEDRILRAFLSLVLATTRTNAWQRTTEGTFKSYLAFKFDPALVPGLPLPRPAFEIWVYAPEFEAVHLRGGKVARGGLRWSDRPEDFRTEVLGLMKAQMVKNAVIVPVGAKGGFFVKRPPEGGERGAVQAEAIRCYRLFLSGMLDITDNRDGDQIIPPADTVRYDEDDPYLVVAADKGTATFSDYANEVSRSYNFWLDDAFASGGSAGYDHKVMAITARGAWESVKRHFREIGRDCQTEPFTCIGIGDMSGDVFGNGMLMSRTIRLLAAFDHRDIFLDPDPDAERAFEERRRLFDLPRSSWQDYDPALISAGGGIYPRTRKSIELSEAAARALGCEAGIFTPNELISAILKAPVDLLWNGGIGTYVKARAETNADAHDKANDALRVNGEELRARIVGEGGNLGLTQQARVAYAMAGGRLNTDFIDNSAGVDCSDHEVNIKILLGEALRAGDLTMKQRDQLLESMTDEVASLVLRDNILQSLALSMGTRQGVASLDSEISLMRKLEEEGRLDRAIEMLPSDDELAERRRHGAALTRPEKCVLLSLAKMSIYDRLLAGGLPDHAYFANDLVRYFPAPLRQQFIGLIETHRLRREIAATWIANSIVNRGLHTFVTEIEDDTGAGIADIAAAFVIARDALDLPDIFAAIEQTSRNVAPDVQLDLFLEVREVAVQATRWMIAHAERPLNIRTAVEKFRPALGHVLDNLELLLPSALKELLAEGERQRVEAGLEPALATRLSRLAFGPAAMDVTLVAQRSDASMDDVARLHFATAAILDLGWVVQALRRLPVRSHWDRLSASALEDQLAASLRHMGAALIAADLAPETPAEAVKAVKQYLAGEGDRLETFMTVLDEIRGNSVPDLAMLTVLARNLDKMALSVR